MNVSLFISSVLIVLGYYFLIHCIIKNVTQVYTSKKISVMSSSITILKTNMFYVVTTGAIPINTNILRHEPLFFSHKYNKNIYLADILSSMNPGQWRRVFDVKEELHWRSPTSAIEQEELIERAILVIDCLTVLQHNSVYENGILTFKVDIRDNTLVRKD